MIKRRTGICFSFLNFFFSLFSMFLIEKLLESIHFRSDLCFFLLRGSKTCCQTPMWKVATIKRSVWQQQITVTMVLTIGDISWPWRWCMTWASTPSVAMPVFSIGLNMTWNILQAVTKNQFVMFAFHQNLQHIFWCPHYNPVVCNRKRSSGLGHFFVFIFISLRD